MIYVVTKGPPDAVSVVGTFSREKYAEEYIKLLLQANPYEDFEIESHEVDMLMGSKTGWAFDGQRFRKTGPMLTLPHPNMRNGRVVEVYGWTRLEALTEYEKATEGDT